jgi:hypothetical protein
MHRSLVAIILAGAVAISSPLEAQGIRYGLGGTVQFSLEDEGGSDFGISGVVDFIPAGNLGFRLDASYLFREGDQDFLINGDAAYHFRTSSESIHPYLLGGVSIAGFDETEFGINAGAGANFHRSGSSIGFFADLRFNRFFDSDASGLQLMGGVRFGDN